MQDTRIELMSIKTELDKLINETNECLKSKTMRRQFKHIKYIDGASMFEHLSHLTTDEQVRDEIDYLNRVIGQYPGSRATNESELRSMQRYQKIKQDAKNFKEYLENLSKTDVCLDPNYIEACNVCDKLLGLLSVSDRDNNEEKRRQIDNQPSQVKPKTNPAPPITQVSVSQTSSHAEISQTGTEQVSILGESIKLEQQLIQHYQKALKLIKELDQMRSSKQAETKDFQKKISELKSELKKEYNAYQYCFNNSRNFTNFHIPKVYDQKTREHLSNFNTSLDKLYLDASSEILRTGSAYMDTASPLASRRTNPTINVQELQRTDPTINVQALNELLNKYEVKNTFTRGGNALLNFLGYVLSLGYYQGRGDPHQSKEYRALKGLTKTSDGSDRDGNELVSYHEIEKTLKDNQSTFSPTWLYTSRVSMFRQKRFCSQGARLHDHKDKLDTNEMVEQLGSILSKK